MNSGNYNGKKKKTAEIKDDDDDGVGVLLRAAQDDVLLKLSLNSHIARATSSSPLDPDLDSRFQALKSNQPKSKSKSKSNLDASKERTITEKKNPERVLPQVAESDDLSARFTALKGSLPSHSSEVRQQQQQLVNDDGEEDDEVEKLIKWAIDAARLDPSPPSDSDNDDEGKDDDDDDDHDDVDSDDEGVDHRKIDAVHSGTKSKK